MNETVDLHCKSFLNDRYFGFRLVKFFRTFNLFGPDLFIFSSSSRLKTLINTTRVNKKTCISFSSRFIVLIFSGTLGEPISYQRLTSVR